MAQIGWLSMHGMPVGKYKAASGKGGASMCEDCTTVRLPQAQDSLPAMLAIVMPTSMEILSPRLLSTTMLVPVTMLMLTQGVGSGVPARAGS